MIVFDLSCDQGHRFEAWFGSSADYEAQQARGLVTCPACDSTSVSKAVMAPAVGAKGNSSRAAANPADVRRAVEENFDDVGRRFPEEARRRAELMAEGGEARGCYGQATLKEAIALVEEGIPVAPLPFRPKSLTDA